MKHQDYKLFALLMNEVHQKAFGEPLTAPQPGKSQILSWFIYEKTGRLLSYKSLSNYLKAILENTPERINPSAETMAILILYTTPGCTLNLSQQPAKAVWFNFRKEKLMETHSN